MNKFMQMALDEAKKGVAKNEGGPFGAVIVCKGKVVAKTHNTVLKEKDATCHAEINAIRIASRKLKRFNLSDCELYSTCEPCPMCYFALQWAKIKKVYCGASSDDADAIGFDDKKMYSVLKNKKDILLRMEKIDCGACAVTTKKLAGNLKEIY
jgi:guanine deaminase